jgi:hypothetical protein
VFGFAGPKAPDLKAIVKSTTKAAKITKKQNLSFVPFESFVV